MLNFSCLGDTSGIGFTTVHQICMVATMLNDERDYIRICDVLNHRASVGRIAPWMLGVDTPSRPRIQETIGENDVGVAIHVISRAILGFQHCGPWVIWLFRKPKDAIGIVARSWCESIYHVLVCLDRSWMRGWPIEVCTESTGKRHGQIQFIIAASTKEIAISDRNAWRWKELRDIMTYHKGDQLPISCMAS